MCFYPESNDEICTPVDTVLANMQVAYWVTLQKKKKKQQQKRDTRAINGQFRLEQKNEK